MSVDPRDNEVTHDIEVDQVYTDSRNSELLELIYIDRNVYVFQRRDETHRFGSRREFEENVAAGRFSLQEDEQSFAVTGDLSDEDKEEIAFEELESIGQSGADNLREKGIVTVRDVKAASDEEILDTSWVGEKGLASIREAV